MHAVGLLEASAIRVFTDIACGKHSLSSCLAEFIDRTRRGDHRKLALTGFSLAPIPEHLGRAATSGAKFAARALSTSSPSSC